MKSQTPANTAAPLRRSARITRSNSEIAKDKTVNVQKKATANSFKPNRIMPSKHDLDFLVSLGFKPKDEWDGERWTEHEADSYELENDQDNLLKPPTLETSTYIDEQGERCFDDSYVMIIQRGPGIGNNHPKVRQARSKKVWTKRMQVYFEDMDPKVNIPLAGRPPGPPYPDFKGSPKRSKETMNWNNADQVCL